MSPKDLAMALADDFALRPSGTVWLKINRAKLVDDLRQRIGNPNLISSDSTNLCGPAAFIRNLATDNPVRYVQAVVNLYESGRAVVGTRVIRAGSDLLKYNTPNDVSPADWIMLASLRDDDNWFFDYQSKNDGASAITMPHSMKSWFEQAGYKDVINETNIFFHKDDSSAKRASNLFSEGYKVCLFINTNMLYDSTHDEGSLHPDHWVVLLSLLDFSGMTGKIDSKLTAEKRRTSLMPDSPSMAGKISVKPTAQDHTYVHPRPLPGMTGTINVKLTVQTWGEEKTVPQSSPLVLESFLKNYYGFVACKY